MTDKNELVLRAKQNSKEIFDVAPDSVVISPAGFILLGDHTHYTESMLLGCALDVYSVVILKTRDDDNINLKINDGPVTTINSDDLSTTVSHFNTLLVIEILQQLRTAGKDIEGFDCYIENDVPLCVGLGYYSSMIMGFIIALSTKLCLDLSTGEMVEIGYLAWKEKIGKIANKATLQCSLLSKENNILYSDLRKNEPELIPFENKDCKFVLFDTNERIENPRDICNERIEECEVGVKGLRLYIWGIKNLRDIKPDFLAKHIHMIPRRVYNRCLYNVNERIRVELARESLSENKYQQFCEQIYKSHEDLASLYEISTDKLNDLVEFANNSNLVNGAKMISCSSFRSIFSLIEKQNIEQFVDDLNKSFHEKHGLKVEKHEFGLSDGVMKME